VNKQKILLIILFTLFIIGSILIVISFKPAIKSVQNYIPISSPLITTIPSISPNLESAKVERVIDGDTILLTSGEKVRYIGINTPEIVDPGKPVECFGKEALEKNSQLVSEQNVLLERDISDKDKYGRILRYVYIQDAQNNKIMINEKLVSEGFAKADVYKPDIKYEDLFAKAQQQAKSVGLGLWGSCLEIRK